MIAYPHTVVQHSGFGYGHNYQFQRAIEERAINTVAELRLVQKEKGVVFESYVAASLFCDSENYPPGVKGILPRVPGTFSTRKIDGLRIYRPGREIFTATEEA